MNRQLTSERLARIEAVSAFAATGLSATEIAIKLDCTRNAIIGLCHRQAIKLFGVSGPPIGYKKATPRAFMPRPDRKPKSVAPARTVYKPSRILMFAGLH